MSPNNGLKNYEASFGADDTIHRTHSRGAAALAIVAVVGGGLYVGNDLLDDQPDMLTAARSQIATTTLQPVETISPTTVVKVDTTPATTTLPTAATEVLVPPSTATTLPAVATTTSLAPAPATTLAPIPTAPEVTYEPVTPKPAIPLPPETVPKSPDYRYSSYDYLNDFDVEGNPIPMATFTITKAGSELPFIDVNLFRTDNPNNQSHPEVPISESYNHWINEGPGSAGDTLVPGDEVIRDAYGFPVLDPVSFMNNNPVIFGHRTSHSKPFIHLDAAAPGDIITITYTNANDTALFGKQFKYVVFNVASIFAGDANGDKVSDVTTFINTPVPGIPNFITVYACDPPGSTDRRLIVQAEPA